jgi:hypothetical protein
MHLCAKVKEKVLISKTGPSITGQIYINLSLRKARSIKN